MCCMAQKKVTDFSWNNMWLFFHNTLWLLYMLESIWFLFSGFAICFSVWAATISSSPSNLAQYISQKAHWFAFVVDISQKCFWIIDSYFREGYYNEIDDLIVSLLTISLHCMIWFYFFLFVIRAPAYFCNFPVPAPAIAYHPGCICIPHWLQLQLFLLMELHTDQSHLDSFCNSILNYSSVLLFVDSFCPRRVMAMIRRWSFFAC